MAQRFSYTSPEFIDVKASRMNYVRERTKAFPKFNISELINALETKNNFVIIHDDDLDGNVAAANIASILEDFERNYQFMPVKHGKRYNEYIQALDASPVRNGYSTFVLDLATTDVEMEVLSRKFDFVTVVDHHESVQDPSIYTGLIFHSQHGEMSTALMTQLLKDLVRERVPPQREDSRAEASSFVSILTDIYDCWRFGGQYGVAWISQVKAEASARALAAYGFRKGYKEIQNICLDNRMNSLDSPALLLDEVLGYGETIVSIDKATADSICLTKCAQRVLELPDGQKVNVALVFHSESMDTVAASILSASKPGAKLLAFIAHIRSDGTVKVSVRSKKNGANAHEVAKQLGGGGGESSAGFEISIRDFTEKVLTKLTVPEAETPYYQQY